MDPAKRNYNTEDLKSFMKKRDRAYEINNGPSYLIIDDLVESIVDDDDLLRKSRKEAEALVEKACRSEK